MAQPGGVSDWMPRKSGASCRWWWPASRRPTRRSALDRQDQPGEQPAFQVGQQFEATLVQARDALDDGQAEAGAAGIAARRVEPGEGTLQAIHLVRGNARTVVADFNP